MSTSSKHKLTLSRELQVVKLHGSFFLGLELGGSSQTDLEV